jgi:hypothetical protein
VAAKKWRRFSTAMPNTLKKKGLAVKNLRRDSITVATVAMKFTKLL